MKVDSTKKNKAIFMLKMTYKYVQDTEDDNLFLCGNNSAECCLLDIHGNILFDSGKHIDPEISVLSNYGKTLVIINEFEDIRYITRICIYDTSFGIKQIYEYNSRGTIKQMPNLVAIYSSHSHITTLIDYNGNIKVKRVYRNIAIHHPTNDVICYISSNTKETFDILDSYGNILYENTDATPELKARYSTSGEAYMSDVF